MALYVGYANNTQYDRAYHSEWGKIKEDVYEIFSHCYDLKVQADGHELEKIREQFSNIPMTNNRVVYWSGETAKFIIDNIKL